MPVFCLFFFFCLFGLFYHCDKYVSEIKQPRCILANVLRYFSPSSSCLLKEKDTVERHKQLEQVYLAKQTVQSMCFKA